MIAILDTLIWITYFVSLYFTVFWFIVFVEQWDNLDNDKKKKVRDYPLVSIVVPAYNEENNIVDTLNSLAELDYPDNKIEVIVINDGSTDSTKNKVEGFIKGKHNFRLINQINMGKAAALNKNIVDPRPMLIQKGLIKS